MSELKPGEIGIAIVSRNDVVAGNEYEVLEVLPAGKTYTFWYISGGSWTGPLPVPCYLCGFGAGRRMLIGIDNLRRKPPPTWDDVKSACGWAPSLGVAA